MEKKRVPIGIVGLDSLLEGGLLPGRSYLATGDAGTGKTTSCMQFVLQGLQKGEKCVYVTVDEKPTDILDSAASLGWELQRYVEDKSLALLDPSPYFGNRASAAAEKGVDLQKIVSDLASYARRMEATRLVIDPITPLILAGESLMRVQEHARLLIHLLQSQLATTNLLTSHAPGKPEQNPGNGIEEFLASGVFILKMSRIGDRFVRTLCVKKMRGTAVQPSEFQFNIVTGKGIVLLSQELRSLDEAPKSSEAFEFFQLPKEES